MPTRRSKRFVSATAKFTVWQGSPINCPAPRTDHCRALRRTNDNQLFPSADTQSFFCVLEDRQDRLRPDGTRSRACGGGLAHAALAGGDRDDVLDAGDARGGGGRALARRVRARGRQAPGLAQPGRHRRGRHAAPGTLRRSAGRAGGRAAHHNGRRRGNGGLRTVVERTGR